MNAGVGKLTHTHTHTHTHSLTHSHIHTHAIQAGIVRNPFDEPGI